jgi:hypothetical protein
MLQKAYGAGREQRNDEITATFTGIVEARPGEVPSVVLELSDVRNLKVKGTE